jgi:hypothetical protein
MESMQELYFMREAVHMILGSNPCLSGDQWWCSAWSWVRNFGGQWWCSAWSWDRILEFLGVNGGVVHGLGIKSLSFWGQWWCSAWTWVRIVGVNGGVVHGLGIESCSAWSWGSMVV